jgi:hypothetical protein
MVRLDRPVRQKNVSQALPTAGSVIQGFAIPVD